MPHGVRHDHLFAQDIFGNDEDHRSGTTRGRDRESAGHIFRDAARIIDLSYPFRQGAEHLLVVNFLKRFAVEVVTRHLADEGDERRRILACRMDADARVRRARPPADEADPGPSRQLAVGVRHIGGAPLLAADDKADVVGGIVKRVENRQIALARHTEDEVGSMYAELVHQDLAAASSHWGRWHRDQPGELMVDGVARFAGACSRSVARMGAAWIVFKRLNVTEREIYEHRADQGRHALCGQGAQPREVIHSAVAPSVVDPAVLSQRRKSSTNGSPAVSSRIQAL